MTKTDLVLRPSEVIDAEVVSETIRAVIVYSPFDNSDRDIVDLDWSEEKTLPQYLDGLQDAQFSVAVNGQIIEAETFDKIPAIKLSRTTMLVIKLIPNKQIVPIIAMVAMVALTVFSGGIAGALALPALLGVSAATAGAIVVAVGGILISGAMMAANALLGPKQKKAITGASYGLDGPQATAQQGLPVPHLYGKFRVSGNKIGVRVENGYTYTVDGKNVFGQMFYGLYAVSEGPISGFSGLMINGTDATNYRNVEVIQRLGDLSKDGAPISWFAEASNIVTYNRALAKAGTQDASDGWIYGASKGEVTRLRFDLELPNGLYYTSKKGNVYNATIEYVIQYRSMQPNQADSDNTNPWITVGTNPGWVDLDGTGGDVNQNITGIRVTSAVVGDVGADGQQPSSDFDFLVQIDHVGDYQQNTGSLVITPDYSAGWATIGHATGTVMNVPIYDAAGNITGYSPGSRTFVYEAPSIRSGKYQWKIVNNTGSASMTRLEGVVSQVTRIKAIIKTTMRWSITSPELDLGYYEYRVCRTDDPDLSGAHVTTCTLTNVAEMTSVQTLYKKTALYAFKTPIDAQMNSEPTPSYLVTGKLVNIYDSTGTVVANQWSDNPADVLLDILLNTGNRFFFDKSRIDFPMFAEWRQFCSDNSLNFNGIFDGKSNVWDVVNTVARVGRASVILRGLKWSLTIERPDIAVMAFTQDNIVKGSFKMTWLGRKDRANLIEVQYADADDFYKQHSVFITDPDYTKFGDAQVKSTINLTGVTSAQQAIKEGRLQLALNKYVTQSCEFDVFIQALAVDVGDVIYVQHDMPMWGFSGRVLEATQNSDGSWNVTSDTPIPADVDKSGSWQVMLLQSAAQIADATVTAIGGNGNTQIQIENYRAPTLPDAWMQGTDPAGTSDFQTNVKAGVHRVIVDGHDYEVLETTIVSATVALLTLSESFHSGTGSTANLFRVDQLVTGNISLGDVDEFNRTQKLTLSGWNNFAPSFFHVNDRIMLGPVKKTGKPFRVTAIDYSDEHVRHVSASEYNDTVYTDNPTYTSNVSSLPTDPMQVTNLVGTVNTTTLQGGALAYTAAFTWNPPLDPPQPFSGASVYQSINGSAFTLVGQITAPNNSYEVSCNVNDNVRLKVVGYGMSLTASYLTAPICSVVVSALGQTPDEPNYFTATGGVLQIALNWQFASDDYIAHYELLASDDNNQANGNTIYIGKTNTFTETGLTPKKTRYYWVRAVAISGAIGVWTGPTSAVTSPVLVTDLEEAIQNTAKYANDLLTSSTQPTLIDGIPASGANLGTSIVFNTKDKRLYQQQADGSWEPMIQAIAVDGKLTADQISDVAAAQVQQSLTSDQIALLQQASQDSSLTTDQKAQINAAATAGIATQDVMNLVAQIMGKQTNATQDQLENLNLANIAGTLSSTAVAAIDIASTSGQVTADKIASVTSTQITGKLTADQIADINAAQVQGQLSSDQIASLDAAKLAGTITADKLSRAPSNNLIWDGCGQDLSNWVIPQDDLKVESVMIGNSLPAMKITALKDTNASIVWQSWNPVFSMALGVPYEYQLKSATTSSTASLGVVPGFFGSDGSFVGEGWANNSTMTAITAVNTLADFTTTWGHGFNFASGRLRLQVNAKAGDVLYITQVLWGASLANVTEPMQWVNGSRPLVNASAVQGQLTDSQLSSIAAAKIAGQLSDGQLNGLSTGKLIGVITSDQIAALAAAKIAGQLSSDQIAALDANKLTGKVVSGQIESLDADLVQGQLALDNIPNIDASKITSVSASTISGQITSDQVQSLAAAKVAGQLTSDQIAGLDSAKLTGKIVSDQITSLDADLVKGQLTLDNIPTIDASKISSVTSTVIQGQITSDQIAALQAVKIAGQLTSDQIISIDSSKLTGQIVSSQIESLNSDRINGQITSTQLSKASSNNILPNDCFSPATTGWRLDANQMNDFQNVVFKSDDTVPGLGNGMFQATASSTSGQFMEVISENFAVAGGSSVEYRIAVGVPQTTAIIVWLAYQTSDGTWTRVAQSSPAAADYTPNDLSTYQTISQLNIKLPADAVAAQLVLRLYNFADQNATKQIIRFTQALVGYSTGTSTEMMTWVAGPKPSVTFDGVAGLLSSDQVASLDAAKLTGKVVSDQIASLDADLVKGQLTLDNIPTIDSSKITSVNAGSIQGQITSDQIASLTAAKVAGQLTSDQIAALDSSKLTGKIVSDQLTSVNADLVQGQLATANIPVIGSDKISSVNSSALQGQLTSDQIAGLDAAKLTSQITSTQISDGSISTPKIAAGAVQTANIAAGAITAEKLSVGSSTNIIWNSCGGQTVEGWGRYYNYDISDYSLTAGAAGIDSNGAMTVKNSFGTSGLGQLQLQWLANFAPGSAKAVQGQIMMNCTSGTVIVMITIRCFNADGTSYDLNSQQVKLSSASGWTTLSVVGQIKSAVSKIIFIPTIFTATGTTAGAFSVDLTRAAFGPAPVNATQVSDWTPGGVTQISGGQLTTGSVKAAQIAANSITSDKIAANAVTANAISANAITGDKIVGQTISADKLAANSITSDQIAANSISGDRLVANTITAVQIAANAITASAISAGAVTTQTLAAGAVTAEKLAVANPSNLIWNDIGNRLDGWDNPSGGNVNVTTWAVNAVNFGNVFLIDGNFTSAGGYVSVFWDSAIPVMTGMNIQAQAKIANDTGSHARVEIAWYDGNMAILGRSIGNNIDVHSGIATADRYILSSVIASPPTNAAYAKFSVVMTDASAAGHFSMRFTQCAIGYASTSATEVAPWSPGGQTQVSGGQIITGSVTAAAIAANAITADKIATNTITSAQIAANSITGDRILANTIGVREIVAHALTSDQIAANSITGDRLVANTITASQIAANAITSNAINAGAITTVKIAAGAITADTIAANAITTAKIAASSITGDKIAVNTITAANITGGTITGDKIAGNTIGANAIIANSLTSAQIAAGSITGDRLSANTITATQIAANAITTSAISAGAVTTQTIAAGAVTSEKLTIASSTNIVGNSTFTLGNAGWNSASLNINNKVFSTAAQHGENVPFGTGALYVAGDSNGKDGIVDCYNSDTLPVQAGQRVCGQVRAMSFADSGDTPGAVVYIGFYDQTGKSIATIASAPVIISGDSSSNLNGYGLVYAFATAPANATACRINLRMTVTANSTGCRTFFTNVALGVVNANTTEVPTWTPGGITTINGALIQTGTLTANQIAANTITGDKIAGNTIGANAIMANSITSSQIAANSITGDRLVANTIGAREIVAGSITATAIASGAITSDKIAANAVTASQIAANAITTQAISAGAVTAQQIAASAITADKLAVASSSNVVWNGTGLMTFDGWNNPGSSSGTFDLYGNQTSLATGNFVVSGATTANAGWANISWNEMLPVISGSGIQAQARIANDAGIPCQVEIHWFDSNKNPTGDITRGNTVAIHSGYVSMNNYLLSSLVATPPSGAAFAQLFIGGSIATAGHFSFRFTNVGFGYCALNATQVSDWTPGGATRVSGGQIITASITASQIAANAITTTQLAANAVTANKIAANTITAGQIAANTITGDRMLANTIGVREIVAHSLTSDQIAANSISGDRLVANTITATQIAANAITTAAISAGAVTAQSIAAGAITAEKLAIASTANLVGNSTLEQTTAGWNVGANWGCSNIAFSSASFSSGMNGGRVFAQWNSTSVTADSRGGVEVYWKNMPVVAGSYYECQMVGYGISSGIGNVFIRFFDKSGNALGDLWSNSIPHFGSFPASLSQMTLAWSHGQAPANAVTAQVIVRLNQDPNSNEANGNLYFTNLLFAQSTANVTSPMAWSAGGVTSIDGGQIVAASITSNQIAANAITAGKLAAGSVVAGTIAGSAVTADTIAANAITTPKISAGAITGDKIAANTITGNNITGGTITGANIAGGTITGSNITGNTITGSNLLAGTVGAREIVAGSISTTQLAAGSITAEKLAVGSSSNLIVNSCFDPTGPGTSEWAWMATGGSSLDNVYPEKNSGFTDCWIHLNTANSGAGMFMDYTPMPVVGGTRYCGAGRFHSFTGMVSQINLIWRDSSNTVISISSSGAVSGGGYGFTADFKQNWVFAVAPANAVTVSFRIIVWNNTSAAISDTGVHATMLQFGPVPANCQTVPDWTAGGVTALNGSMIKTGTLTASKIAANTITAGQIAGKTITADQIQSGSLTADVIAANAIGATQIAAGAVYSDAIQANAITASKLSAGSVTAQAIAAGSITSDKLTVANTSNVLSNACCYNSIDGWSISGNQKVVTTRFWGQNQSTESSYVYGMPGAKFFGDKDAIGTTDAWIEIAASDRIAISSNQYIIASAMLCTQWGVSAAVIINFFDASGKFIAQSWGNRVNGSTPYAGNGIQNYTQSWVNVASPNGSRYAQFLIHADWGTRTDTQLGAVSFTQAMLGYGRAGVTEAPTWTAGGTTTVTGGMITAQTITGVQIAANAITADKIVAGTITGDKIAGNTISAMSIAANTITTLQIAAGGITGDRLAANTITANQIGAGAVTTEKLAVGSTANLIWNSCLDDRGAQTNGWASNQTTVSVGVNGWTGNDNYRLKGYGTGGIYTSGTVNSGDVVFADWYGTLDGNTYGVATKAGARFFGSAQVIPGSEFDAYAELEWLDLNGNSVGQSAGAIPGSYSTKVDQWGDLDGYYTRISTVGTAPAGTCWVRLRIVFRCNKSVSNVNNFFTKALLTQVADNVNDVPLWTPGGTTVIDGSTVRTGTLNASKIVAGSITGDKIAANTIYASSIVGNSITAGQIQAGAIGADQIAANAIRARNLAVDDVLIANSAQIGNLVVGTSNIADNSVTSYANGWWPINASGAGGTITFSCSSSSVGIISAAFLGDVSTSVDGSQVLSSQITINVNGNVYTYRSNSSCATITVPQAFGAGNTNVQVIGSYNTSKGGTAPGRVAVVVLGRMK